MVSVSHVMYLKVVRKFLPKGLGLWCRQSVITALLTALDDLGVNTQDDGVRRRKGVDRVERALGILSRCMIALDTWRGEMVVGEGVRVEGRGYLRGCQPHEIRSPFHGS